MSRFDNILIDLKQLQIIQTKEDWEDNIPYDIWNKYFKGKGKYKIIEDFNKDVQSINYNSTNTILEIENRLLGITYIKELKGDRFNNIGEIYFIMRFNEMVLKPRYECI